MLKFSAKKESLCLSGGESRFILVAKSVRRTATPINDVFVLTFAAFLSIPIGNPQIIVHYCRAKFAIPQNNMKKALGGGGDKIFKLKLLYENKIITSAGSNEYLK